MATPSDETTLPAGRLSTLPPELRLRIYRYLMRAPDSPRGKGPRLCFDSQVLRTCKAIYNEALAVLYGENTFATWPDALNVQFCRLDDFFAKIGQRGRDQIRCVGLGGQWNAISAARRLWKLELTPTCSLGSFEYPNLEVVRVGVHVGYMDHEAIMDAYNLFCWEAIVRDEVRPEHFAYSAFGGLRTCRWEIMAEAENLQRRITDTHTYTRTVQYRMRFSFHTDASRFHLVDPPETVEIETREETLYWNFQNPLASTTPSPWSNWTVSETLKT